MIGDSEQDRPLEELKHPVTDLEEFSWLPVNLDRILTSMRWQQMKDFQRGWYTQLLLVMTRSKPLGYLPLDGLLWTLAGAQSKSYFQQNAAVVLACFKVVEFDGLRWVYSEPLLNVMISQQSKRVKHNELRRLANEQVRTIREESPSYSKDFEFIWKIYIWKSIGKRESFLAYKEALLNLKREMGFDAARAHKFLCDAMKAFKDSDAGRDSGLFDGYTAPHPATWLRGERYLDDQAAWIRREIKTERATVHDQSATKAERRNADISATTRKVFGHSGRISGNSAENLPDKNSGG